MVPMHLGLIDGSFVPHNLISAQENPVPLPKFQMVPRLKILTSSVSKKGTQIYYPFLSKIPSMRIPSGFPNGAPMKIDTHSRAVLNISFGVPSKGAVPPGPPPTVVLLIIKVFSSSYIYSVVDCSSLNT